MRQKWEQMTPDEREAARSRMRERHEMRQQPRPQERGQ